jgi:receptor expression-enhancing protein 1/2/3/4
MIYNISTSTVTIKHLRIGCETDPCKLKLLVSRISTFILSFLSRFSLVFGTIYPAYCSYKAIRTKNVKEYVRWMMHWVVFSCFVTLETFSDMFISWFPFYYEAKLLVVFWLLSPMTKGSSILYKKFIHPKLSRHEQEIDEYINQAKERGYKTVIDVGTKTFDFASKLIVETAIKVSKEFQ